MIEILNAAELYSKTESFNYHSLLLIAFGNAIQLDILNHI